MNTGAERVHLFTHETPRNSLELFYACYERSRWNKIQKCWCLREKPAKILLEERARADDKLALLHDMRCL